MFYEVCSDKLHYLKNAENMTYIDDPMFEGIDFPVNVDKIDF